MQAPLGHHKSSLGKPLPGVWVLLAHSYGATPPPYPAHEHVTHTPATGTQHAGGHRPRCGSCRSPQRPSQRAAAPGLRDGWPSPPAMPQLPPVAIAPASCGGEIRQAALEDGDCGVTTCKPSHRINLPARTEKTYPERAPAHNSVTSVPTCPYCTPRGTHTPSDGS